MDQLCETCKTREMKREMNKKQNHEASALYCAIKEGHNTCVQIMIDEGVDVNSMDQKGTTPLIHAAKYSRLTCVNLLLQGGANVNRSNHSGQTALINAAANGNEDIVTALIQARASVNVKSKQGDTALIAASLTGLSKYLQCVQLLVLAGADVNARNVYGPVSFTWTSHGYRMCGYTVNSRS